MSTFKIGISENTTKDKFYEDLNTFLEGTLIDEIVLNSIRNFLIKSKDKIINSESNIPFSLAYISILDIVVGKYKEKNINKIIDIVLQKEIEPTLENKYYKKYYDKILEFYRTYIYFTSLLNRNSRYSNSLSSYSVKKIVEELDELIMIYHITNYDLEKTFMRKKMFKSNYNDPYITYHLERLLKVKYIYKIDYRKKIHEKILLRNQQLVQLKTPLYYSDGALVNITLNQKYKKEVIQNALRKIPSKEIRENKIISISEQAIENYNEKLIDNLKEGLKKTELNRIIYTLDSVLVKSENNLKPFYEVVKDKKTLDIYFGQSPQREFISNYNKLGELNYLDVAKKHYKKLNIIYHYILKYGNRSEESLNEMYKKIERSLWNIDHYYGENKLGSPSYLERYLNTNNVLFEKKYDFLFTGDIGVLLTFPEHNSKEILKIVPAYKPKVSPDYRYIYVNGLGKHILNSDKYVVFLENKEVF